MSTDSKLRRDARKRAAERQRNQAQKRRRILGEHQRLLLAKDQRAVDHTALFSRSKYFGSGNSSRSSSAAQAHCSGQRQNCATFDHVSSIHWEIP